MNYPDKNGHFGQFGGRYVSETLMPALLELEQAYKKYQTRPGVQGGVRLLPAAVCRPAQSPLFCRKTDQKAGRGKDLPETGGPEPYRRPQDQQHRRPGAAGQTDGEEAGHRRDRGRAAWRGDRHHCGAHGDGVRGIHGGGGYSAPVAQRLQDETARGDGNLGLFRHGNPEGCHERGDAQLGDHASETPSTSSARWPVRIPIR